MMRKMKRLVAVALFVLVAALLGARRRPGAPLVRAAPPALETVAFVGVTVIPMDAERRLADQTVVVSEGRIVALGARGEIVVPEGARRVDGRGKLLMPGLIDMHAHL